MIRAILVGFVLLLCTTGCQPSGQQSSGDDDWFRKRNVEFDRQHAEHVKESSKAVRGYRQYRNRQP